MKQHHKVGNRQGRPAYRTPSWFKNAAKAQANSVLINKNRDMPKSPGHIIQKLKIKD